MAPADVLFGKAAGPDFYELTFLKRKGMKRGREPVALTYFFYKSAARVKSRFRPSGFAIRILQFSEPCGVPQFTDFAAPRFRLQSEPRSPNRRGTEKRRHRSPPLDDPRPRLR